MKTNIKYMLITALSLATAAGTAFADDCRLSVMQQPHGGAPRFLYQAVSDESVAFYNEGRGMDSNIIVVPPTEPAPKIVIRDSAHGQMAFLFGNE